MIEHGISTSKADFWLHLHPFDCAIWFYRRERCLQWLNEEKPQLIDGRSKDPSRSITGAGYLLPKSLLWIGFISIDWRLFHWRDEKMTDREWGLRGESLFRFLVESGLVHLPKNTAMRIAAGSEQLEWDFALSDIQPTTYEVKTERKQTPNLFVQSGEEGHEVHYAPDGEHGFSSWDSMWVRPFDFPERI